MTPRPLSLVVIVVGLLAACGPRQMDPSAGSMLPASELIGLVLRIESGEPVGQVEFVILDPRSAQIVYAVVALPSGTTLFAKGALVPQNDRIRVVPWEIVRFGQPGGHLTVRATSEDWHSAPLMRGLPQPLVAGWDTEIQRYWGGRQQ